MKWNTKELEMVSRLAFRNYQERVREGVIGSSEEDWALAELEFIRIQECENKDICKLPM